MSSRPPQPSTLPLCLSIAGSDPSCGAGAQLDIRIFERFNCAPLSVLTALTVQNSTSVDSVELLSADFVRAQLDALLRESTPKAAKSGMLGAFAAGSAAFETLQRLNIPLVIDPVLKSSSQATLGTLTVSELRILIEQFATLITPNRFEAEQLCGCGIDSETEMCDAAVQLSEQLRCAVYLKGGHVTTDNEVIGILSTGGRVEVFRVPRIPGATEIHGTGCALSAAICSLLAHDAALPLAVAEAQRWMQKVLQSSVSNTSNYGVLNLPRFSAA